MSDLRYEFGTSQVQVDAWRKRSPYALLIRDPARDPERQTRGMRGQYGVDPHNKLSAMALEDLRCALWTCLSEHPGRHMTFNELAVRLFDLTADIAFDTPLEDALWSLLVDGCVGMTMQAPIYWLRTCDVPELTREAPIYQPRQLSLF